MPSIPTNGIKRTSMGNSSTKASKGAPQPSVRKRRLSKSDLAPVFERMDADENLAQSGGEEEPEEMKSVGRIGISQSIDEDDFVSENKLKKGQYYVINANDVRTERYSMDYHAQLHTGEDIDDDLEGEPLNNMAYINERWKADYNNGVQLLMKPSELPKFLTEERLLNTCIEIRPKNFKVPKGLIITDDTPCTSGEHEVVKCPRPNFRYYLGDLKDVSFLKRLNCLRKMNRKKTILEEVMFDVVNALEIEAFKKIHQILLQPLHSPSSLERDVDDEAPCDICTSVECELEDFMVFCDGCNMCVHGLCYGLPDLPQGDWLCMKCQKYPGNTPPCVLCPTIGGSLKMTDNGQWAHVLCALYLPECRFKDAETREPITNIDDIPDERWQMKCVVCDTRQGACIQCSEKECKVAFHATCGSRSGFEIRTEQNDQNDPEGDINFITKCRKHSRKTDDAIEKEKLIEHDTRLRQLEKNFFLYADYEIVAKRLKLDVDVVSDIYEYWKQKRSENQGKSLIENLDDNVKVQGQMLLMENLQLPTTSKISYIPDEETLATCSFFERKMYRQKYVRGTLDQGRNLLTQIIRREKIKRHKQEQEEKALMLIVQQISDKMTISHRATESVIEDLELLMTSEEIDRAKSQTSVCSSRENSMNPDGQKVTSPMVGSKMKAKRKAERRTSDTQVKKPRRTASPDDSQKENGTKKTSVTNTTSTPSPLPSSKNHKKSPSDRKQLLKLRSHNKALRRRTIT